MLANNVANAATGGYKGDHEFYSMYLAQEAQEAEGSPNMPVIERPWTDFSQGVVHETGNQTDLALTGAGFFSVDGPQGALYTRNGSFRISPNGRLVTAEGYAVRGQSGASLTLDPARPFQVSGDGTVRQEGAAVGRLEIAGFQNTAALAKQGNNYFYRSDPDSSPSPATATVEQGKLEASNVGSAEAAVRLVSVMRQFEMLQKAVVLGGEMNRRAIEEVAKVGS